MQFHIQIIHTNKSGYALLITLIFVVIALIVFSSTMVWMASSSRVTNQNNLYNVSEIAAQSAAEAAISSMCHDFRYQCLNDPIVYQVAVANLLQTNWPIPFAFFSTNGTTNTISVSINPVNWSTNWQALSSQYSGLYGAVANCTVIAQATPLNQGYNMSAKVTETLQLASIPVFQYGAFYNMDLDFSPGQSLTMNGKVHCNGTIYMYPQASATFKDVVEATLWVTNKDNPNDQQNLTSYTKPAYAALATGKNPISQADALTLPINGANTNAKCILNLPPIAVRAPDSAAYRPTNQIYLYNECDLIISNAATGVNGALGTNITIYYQDNISALTGGPLYQLTNNEVCTYSNSTTHVNFYTGSVSNSISGTSYLLVLQTNGTYKTMPTSNNWVRVASSFPFVTNVVFYDFREGKTVQAVQIDVSKLAIWLTNTATEGYRWNFTCGGTYGMGLSPLNTGTKGHPIDSIYVYNNVPLTATTLPAVRVVNGACLPSHWGLTIATPMPLYTLGDYNIQTDPDAAPSQISKGTADTTWTWPAALMGDSITILSSSWNDANSMTKSGNSYNAPESSKGNRVVGSDVTVNAACLEGIVPSIYTTKKQYSGGLENFLRLQEDWNGHTLWYNGSIVVMFSSAYATNYWIGPSDRSGYRTHNYTVPTRKWGFDANFSQQDKLPPCTPQIKAIIRGTWSSQ